MANYSIKEFPKSRIATIDIGKIGRQKHHIAAILEIDITNTRNLLKAYRKSHSNISLNAWLIKAISHTVASNKTVASFLYSKRKQIIFEKVNVSLLVEKQLDGFKAPFPLLIEDIENLELKQINDIITNAKSAETSKNEIVLNQKPKFYERLYYYLPSIFRIIIWKFMLAQSKFVFAKMGNIAISSIANAGTASAWFIPISIHPISIGISSISQKPWVVDGKIEIREILNLSVLIDHDVVDGMQMAKFMRDLSRNIESGIFLK